jgi:hypothetical protein
MNRRDFLIALGLAACGPRTPPTGGGTGRRGSGVPTTDARPSIVDDWSSARTTQFDATRLLVRGEQLVRLTANELQFVDITTLATRDRVTETYRSVCMLPSKVVLAFTHTDTSPCELDVFEGTTLARSISIPSCGTTTGAYVVAAGTSDIYMSDGHDGCVRYRLASNALTEIATFKLEERARDNLGQAVGLADGRMLVPAGRRIQAYDGARVDNFLTKSSIGHLCAAADGRVWQSLLTKPDEATPGADPRLDRIALTRLDSADADASISFAPARITHMASAADGSLAVMLFMDDPRAAGWTIVVLDAKAVERRRIKIDGPLMNEVGVDFNAAFVALTSSMVVVDAGRHGLFGWNLSTGARI